MGDPTTCVCQFIYDEKDKNDTQIIQYFIMHGLGICMKADSYVAHFFCAWLFSNNTAFPIAKNNNKCFLSLNTNTIVFDWRAGNSNKNEIWWVYKLI